MDIFDFLLVLALLDPAYSFAVHPTTELYYSLLVRVDAHASLLAVDPHSIILATVWPQKYAVTFFFIVKVLAAVLPFVGPSEDALAVHFVG